VSRARTPKVLLVDDRAENRLAVRGILATLDVDIVEADSGEAALKRLLTDTFAVILLDVQMPGMDGFEVARHIQLRERTRGTPIVFLTAMDRDSHQALRGYAAGAVDYIAKPFDPWVLRAKVGVLVQLYEAQRELALRSDGAALAAARQGIEEIDALLARGDIDGAREAATRARAALARAEAARDAAHAGGPAAATQI
jgi:CheY-like chemotaxis protein